MAKQTTEGLLMESPTKEQKVYTNKWDEAMDKGWTMMLQRTGQNKISAPQKFHSKVYDSNEVLVRDFSGDGNALAVNGSNFTCNLSTARQDEKEIAQCFAILSGLTAGYRPKAQMVGGVQRKMPTWGVITSGSSDQLYEVVFLEEMVASKNSKTANDIKYLQKVLKMEGDSLKHLSVVALGLNAETDDDATIQAKLIEILQSPNKDLVKSVMRFIDMMDGDKFKIYYYLKTATGDEKEMKGVYRKSDGVYFMDSRLGIDYDQAVEFISSKKDADKINIIQALKSFVGK